MFGGKNKISPQEAEKLKELKIKNHEFIEEISGKEENIHSILDEVRDSENQSNSYWKQIDSNIDSLLEMSKDNVNSMAGMSYELGEYARTAEESQADFERLQTSIGELNDNLCMLVDGNKHYTEPSKYLSEVPAGLKARNAALLEKADRLLACSKQMGVLALNSAIEAGRMGEQGKSFVTSAEEVRNYTSSYDQIVEELRAEVASSNEEIEKMSVQISHLVAMLKENNIATTRILKESMELAKSSKSADVISADELRKFKEQAVTVKNAQEEILKIEERNKIQAADLGTESEIQMRKVSELGSELKEIFDVAERLKTEMEEDYE